MLFGNDEDIHQLDFSDTVLDLAPACNLDNERDVGTIKYKLRSLEQSSCPCSSKFYVKAKLVDRAGARAVDLGGAKRLGGPSAKPEQSTQDQGGPEPGPPWRRPC